MTFGFQMLLGSDGWRRHNFSITAGTAAGPTVGYSTFLGIGSISNATLPDQRTIIVLVDEQASNVSSFLISGFTSDPGRSYFGSLTANGRTVTTASAFDYSYSSGTATWRWLNLFGFIDSSNYPAVLSR